LAIDPRERELQQEVVKAKTELRRLKNRQKNIANSGVTDADIDSQNKIVKAAENDLKTFRDERISSLGGKTKAERDQEKLAAKEQELQELQRRAQEGEPAPRPGVFRGGVPEREVRVSDIERAQAGVARAQTKTSEQEQSQVSAYERPLDSSQLRREVSGAGISIIGVNPNEMDKLLPTGVGRFALEGQDDELFIIPSPGSLLSSLVSSTRFARALYNLPANEVARYEKTLGLTETGRMTRALEEQIIGIVEEVSYLNYQGAFTGKPAIDWEQALINPERFGLGKARGAGAGGPAGPSPEQIRARAESIELLSTELGIEIDKNNIQKLARDWASGLFDANTIKAQIARVGTIDFNKGAAAETLNNLRQYASDLGVQYDETWYNKAVTRVLKYKDDIETYNNQIREIAKSQYPTLAEQIDSGFTVRQLASPYTQSMSRLLEIDPGTISLNDRTIRQALTGLNPEGKPMTTPLWQFEQQLRQDPRWNYTNNAQEELMGTARQVLKNFGLVG
jgi:hypothetical protein